MHQKQILQRPSQPDGITRCPSRQDGGRGGGGSGGASSLFRAKTSLTEQVEVKVVSDWLDPFLSSCTDSWGGNLHLEERGKGKRGSQEEQRALKGPVPLDISCRILVGGWLSDLPLGVAPIWGSPFSGHGHPQSNRCETHTSPNSAISCFYTSFLKPVCFQVQPRPKARKEKLKSWVKAPPFGKQKNGF